MHITYIANEMLVNGSTVKTRSSCVIVTRNSAIADKLRDAFRGQSRSPNMVPFGMLGMASY